MLIEGEKTNNYKEIMSQRSIRSNKEQVLSSGGYHSQRMIYLDGYTEQEEIRERGSLGEEFANAGIVVTGARQLDKAIELLEVNARQLEVDSAIDDQVDVELNNMQLEGMFSAC